MMRMESYRDTLATCLGRLGKVAPAILALAAVSSVGMSAVSFYQTVNDKASVPQDRRRPEADVPAAALPDAQAIARLGWFGMAKEERPTPSAGSANLSHFTLKGISRSDEPALAGAFIAGKDGAETYYRIGDALPGDAGTLEEIQADRVAIRTGRGRAVLSLDSGDKPASPAVSTRKKPSRP